MRLKAIASAAILSCGLFSSANANPFVVTMEQVGPNVVASGSGDISLIGLSAGIFDFSPSAGILPSNAEILMTSGTFDQHTGVISGPSNFGPGGATFANSTNGDVVGILATAGLLDVPNSYVSDTLLSDTATFDNATFASLGVTPGIYKWTWGTTSPDQSFTLDIIAPTPLPAALPLFATGLAGLGLIGWRRKRKAQA